MEDLFSGRNYRLNKSFMGGLGFWPEQRQSTRIFRAFFFNAIVGTIVVPELVRLYDISGNIDDIIESLPCLLIIGVGWVKSINTTIKKTQLLELVYRMRNDYLVFAESSSSIAILNKHAELGRKLTMSYAILFYGAATAFAGFPALPWALDMMAPLNATRPRKFLYPTEYRVDPERYYIYMLLHSYVTTFTCVAIYVALDTMLAVWVEHCCALFEIVGYNLAHVIEKLNTVRSEVHFEYESAYQNLCSCIRQHKEALMFANLIESTYSTAFIGITGGNMIVMSITGVLLLIKFDDTEEAIRYAALTVGQVYHLYYSSIGGQKILDHSNAISSYAYESDWCEFSCRAQKLLTLIIARAQKPCLLTAGKIYIMNMESFSAVLKTSISYFTVLSSLR